jgi:thioredoxin-like negative regulator of GroEL
MSILSDLLSKIRQPLPSKEVPPGLRSTVSAIKKKESNKRRIVIIIALSVLAVSSGFVLVYLTEVYLKGGVKQTAYQRGITGGPVAQQAIPSPSVSDKGPKEERRQATDNKQVADRRRQNGEKTVNNGINEKRSSPETIRSRSQPGPSTRTPMKVTPSSLQPVEGHDKKETILGIPEGGQPVQQEGQKVTTKAERLHDTSEKDLYLYMARAYESKRDYTNALLSYKKVLGIEHGNYRVMNNIASILIKLNLYDEAKTYLQKALDLRADYVPAIINTGIVFAKNGETKDAENILLRALMIEPDNRDALFNLAILYEKRGSFEKARQYYSQLKQIGDPRGESGLERIRVVK